MRKGCHGFCWGRGNFAKLLIYITKTSLILQTFQNRSSAGPQKPEKMTTKNQVWKVSTKNSNYSLRNGCKIYFNKVFFKKTFKFVDYGQIKSIFKNWQHQKIKFDLTHTFIHFFEIEGCPLYNFCPKSNGLCF